MKTLALNVAALVSLLVQTALTIDGFGLITNFEMDKPASSSGVTVAAPSFDELLAIRYLN